MGIETAMPRYFLDLVECGTRISDEEGLHFADLTAARAAAVQGARDVMCGEVAQSKLCLSCCIEVRDSSGKAVLEVPFREAVEVTG